VKTPRRPAPDIDDALRAAIQHAPPSRARDWLQRLLDRGEYASVCVGPPTVGGGDDRVREDAAVQQVGGGKARRRRARVKRK
jgi:hypothetical protein